MIWRVSVDKFLYKSRLSRSLEQLSCVDFDGMKLVIYSTKICVK